MHLNAFLYGCGHHSAAWRHPDSRVEDLGKIAYYEELAQLAERGKFDAVFFADGHSVRDPAGAGTWFLEPITALSAMARATTHIGLVTTVSSTFYTPFHAARMLASLDHISGGRAGWNVVTSMFDAEARNHGMDAIPAREERYARAEEFVDTALALWDSWEPDALTLDRTGMYADPAKVHSIDHDGKHFRVDGPLTVPRSPQGRPVLFQAGASGPGRDLAATYAEAIYAVAYDLVAAQSYYDDVKARIDRAGRDSAAVGIMPGLVTYIGSTMEEAHRKKAELDVLLPTEQSLAMLSTFTGQDCAAWELDEPVPPLPPAAEFTGPQGRYETILRIIEKDRPTVRQLLGTLAAGGGHATMIGTPDSIADEMESWIGRGADGFNLMCPRYPDSLADFVEHVVPILQQRGLFRSEYTSSTLRGHLTG
ncbi:LLM class flavin-dependent oxidoreductase [Rhodococcoides fascians]|uniref:LLM class flavin-dependent oxidoreductase n=1 Tax=Rhodococcoides fascians TaxID=1828 RepID=UPI000B9B24BC|nr:LLM class flavin-dependent oxidoreductase [Rhodococcus fascians]OZE90401.1 LLM class flavin-dependent oxidoreductase [Rhodococcus fascians]OZF19198.1 LLM class flavin-dependent oxidoreductase [Rhodococcus fascians]OZF22519.1 LLM class flavin-dependent oxidoreductase [Rhodococcus fascians]OZF68110.1 LLM class flavin-dependent oxidoreductase [Rhodococcus fascians]OZF71492.1 LLM class flavin-dependent oxidoreductase [Rhodococcus fascians]